MSTALESRALRVLRPTILVLLAALVAPVAAEAAIYDVKRVLRDDIRRVAPRTDVPIRLPRSMNLDYSRAAFGDGGRTARGYDFTIATTADCGNATACFLASFTGEEGGTYAFRRRVRLARGIVGRYKPLTCGASCSPPTIEWEQRGFLYRLQAKLGVSGAAKQRAAMVRAANSAIRSRPR